MNELNISLDAITRVMYEVYLRSSFLIRIKVCEDAVKDGVSYLGTKIHTFHELIAEVRFSPILHIQEGLSLSQIMEAICEGAAMAGKS